jgi:AcrR family transcriptional regulator
MPEGNDRERTWEAGPVRVRVTLPSGRRADRPEPKERLTTERIVDAAMALMEREGYDAVSMRSLARELDTGPASLYAHVANRDELDQLVMDRIASQITIPEPDPERWAEQLMDLLRETLAVYRAHPGAARAAMGQVPTREGTMRVAEAMMAIALAGGISPQAAAWFCDTASLYVGALAYEESIWLARENSTEAGAKPDHATIDAELTAFWDTLPPDQFPLLIRYASEMTSGDGDVRFEFGIDLLVSGLAAVSEKYR